MKFETVRIHFLSDVLVCCHSRTLLPWQRDVTTSSLYRLQTQLYFLLLLLSNKAEEASSLAGYLTKGKHLLRKF